MSALSLCVPCRVELSRLDCAASTTPVVWALLPRCAYLRSALLQHAAFATLKEASVEVGGATLWFTRDDADGSPLTLRADLPLGVLTDADALQQKKKKQPQQQHDEVFTRLTVHFQRRPASVLTDDCSRLFFHALKQALFVGYGSCGAFYSLSAQDQCDLFSSLNTEGGEGGSHAAEVVARLFPPTVMRVPVRIVSSEQQSRQLRVRQPVVSPSSTLSAVLLEAGAGSGCLIQGLRVPPDCPMQQLWAQLRHGDGWLYVVVVVV